MSVIRDVVYAPELGEFGKLDLYLPETQEPCPMFIFFHGGGIVNGNRGNGTNPSFLLLASRGIAVASVEYRMYQNDPAKTVTRGSVTPESLLPDSPRYPVFIEDCATSIAWLQKNMAQYHAIDSWYVGGSSAGGYLSMMLFFDTSYLAKHGIDARSLDGYFFDAGQPTVHFNVLGERGLDSRLVRIDEAAPLYWIDHSLSEHGMPKVHIIYSDHDIYNRPEQSCLLYRTMLHFGYDENKVKLIEMRGYTHTGYCKKPYVYAAMIEDLIRW